MRTPLTGLKTQTEIALSETDPAQMRLALQLIADGQAVPVIELGKLELPRLDLVASRFDVARAAS